MPSIKVMRLKFILVIFLLFLLPVLSIPFFIDISDQPLYLEINGKFVFPHTAVLPNNKFYQLKKIRDKIVLFFIFDQLSKIESNLFLADKLLSESKILYKRGDTKLAEKTALKAENYFTQMVTEYKWQFWKHKYIPELLDERISWSVSNRQQIYEDMASGSSGNDKETFQLLMSFSRRNNQSLIDLKK